MAFNDRTLNRKINYLPEYVQNRGRVSIGVLDEKGNPTGYYEFLGDVINVSIQGSNSSEPIRESYSGRDATRATINQDLEVTFSATLREFSDVNLLLALFADQETVAAAPATSLRTLTLPKGIRGKEIKLVEPGITNLTVRVNTPTPVTLVAETDFEYFPDIRSLVINESVDATQMPDDATVTIEYEHEEYNRIQMFNKSAVQLPVHLDMVNKVSNKGSTIETQHIELGTVDFDPVSDLPLMLDTGIQEFEISGRIIDGGEGIGSIVKNKRV